MFDAHPYAVDERLATDPVLAPLVARRPGRRGPRAVPGGVLLIMPGSRRLARHLAVPRSSHAAPGQQVPVAAGRRLGGVLVAAYGQPLRTPGAG
ncbi:hypothetical protein [Streptomyces sp. RTd22]|uniref:hypothetical protein n=1 Tax=Streptomyces sp. RTd22 TaxID=1841249 RepID=UPI0007C4E1EC